VQGDGEEQQTSRSKNREMSCVRSSVAMVSQHDTLPR
jgi:hypothetical protein